MGMYASPRRRLLLLALALLSGATVSNAQVIPALHAYESCTFSDGLQIVDLASLSPGATSLPIETRKGTQPLRMVTGRRVMFAYPDTDFYANLKVELLPQDHYAEQKQLVTDGLDYLLASSSDNTRNYGLPGKMNGFDVQGFDRSKLEGGVLGFYLLLDDTDRIVTTIYFLNQDPDRRKFQTMSDYARLRDQFLRTYTACIRVNLSGIK